MNYLGMRRGNKMPAVGVLQILLNASGADLNVDGDFGRATFSAVKNYQKERLLHVDGIVGKNTWLRLVRAVAMPIGDSIDIWEKAGAKEWAPEYKDIRNTGSNPFIAAPSSNGSPLDIVFGLAQHYRDSQLCVLRFHGHGYPGGQQIFGGLTGIRHEGKGDYDYGMVHGIWFENEKVRRAFSQLKYAFGRYGSIQLNGCRVGAGEYGRKLLSNMADTVRVPVTAGLRTQYAGGTSATFFMEGALRTATPDGKSLKQWCAQLPEIEMSVI